MPVDVISQGGVSPARSTVPSKAPAVSQAEAVARQELPAAGSVLPSLPGATAPREADVRQAVRKLTDYVQSLKRDLQFNVDEDAGVTVIKVVDSESGEVIRQIPPDEILAIARHFAEGQGALLKTKA